VRHGSAVAAGHLHACLRADERAERHVASGLDAFGIVLGFDFDDLGGLVAVDADDATLSGVDEDFRAAGWRGEQTVRRGDLGIVGAGGHDGLLGLVRAEKEGGRCKIYALDGGRIEVQTGQLYRIDGLSGVRNVSLGSREHRKTRLRA
jgi:hypothetical protein